MVKAVGLPKFIGVYKNKIDKQNWNSAALQPQKTDVMNYSKIPLALYQVSFMGNEYHKPNSKREGAHYGNNLSKPIAPSFTSKIVYENPEEVLTQAQKKYIDKFEET